MSLVEVHDQRALQDLLGERWYPLIQRGQQVNYTRSPHRFNVIPAGRRSGKTERAKRRLVYRALNTSYLRHNFTPRFFAAAPTRPQAKQIFWDDLKALTRKFWMDEPSETELRIRLLNGAEIFVVGLDRPQRIEGMPWDGGIIDEVADVDPEAWPNHIRPALSTKGRPGWCDFTGVPEGRNHYYDMYVKALARMMRLGAASPWGAYTWPSSDILSPEELEQAREDLDEQTFDREYNASFLNFAGRAYYNYTDANKAPVSKLYTRTAPLIFCFDFNVSPGVAVVAQEMMLKTTRTPLQVTSVIGEVHIPVHSNSPAIAKRLIKDWGAHTGQIYIYGDASGAASGSAKVKGSDWVLIRDTLLTHFPRHQLTFRIPLHNPQERLRVNAVTSRICSASGVRRLLVDPAAAPETSKDLEGVQLLKGGSGELDKTSDKKRTHWSDALGYYIHREFPITGGSAADEVLSL